MEKLLAEIRKTSLVRKGERVLIGCSGGRDSMFLSEFFFRFRKKLGVEFAIGHIEHGLRGKTSKEDAAFVEEYANSHGIAFFQRELRLGKEKAPHGIEELARRKRYEALESICKENGFQKLAVAHHREDQIETVLLRTLQGAAPRFWQGMQVSRPLRQNSEILLIRPLLSLSRKQIDSWVREQELPYREDETNQNSRFVRNRLRIGMKQLQSKKKTQLDKTVLQMKEQAIALTTVERRLQDLFLKRFSRSWESSRLIELKNSPELPEELLRHLVERTLRELKGAARPGTIDAVCKLWKNGRSGARALDPAGIEIKRIGSTLQFLQKEM